MDLASRNYLFLDCQTTGLALAKAEILELGWSFSFEQNDVQTRLLRPKQIDTIPKVVWRMTGILPEEVEVAMDAEVAWKELVEKARGRASVIDCAVIHYSQFERPFLESLHKKVFGDEPFPWPIVCTYQLAKRLDADLPARTLRALSGYLGFDLPEQHRSRDHVIATQKIWRHHIESLQSREAVRDWESFQDWLSKKTARSKLEKVKKRFLAPKQTRSDLPDRPGVYEMLSKNGQVLYVGKATSLKSRVGSYFQQRKPERSRLNELMTQVADVRVTETATSLEAALLENDRIKELEPPYNQLLRSFQRRPVYVARDGVTVSESRDARFAWGPFTSINGFESLHRLLRVHSGTPTEEDLLYLNHPVEEIQAKFKKLLNDFGVEAERPLGCVDLIRLGKKISGPAPEEDVEASLHRRLKRVGRLLHEAYWRRRLMQSRICWNVAENISEKRATKDASSKWRVIELKAGRIASVGYIENPALLDSFTGIAQNQREKADSAIELYDRIRILFTEITLLAKKGHVHIRFSSTRRYLVSPHLFLEESA